MNQKISKLIIWLARILAILLTIFISLFALDVLSESYGPLKILVGLFIHLIPTFILIIVLVIAWKREIRGGIIFILLGISALLFFNNRILMTLLILAGPLFLIGLLFISAGLLKKKI